MFANLCDMFTKAKKRDKNFSKMFYYEDVPTFDIFFLGLNQKIKLLEKVPS